MNKAEQRISKALNQNICELAQSLYGKDIVCGQGCPLLDDDCPIIMDENKGAAITRRYTDLIREFKEK